MPAPAVHGMGGGWGGALLSSLLCWHTFRGVPRLLPLGGPGPPSKTRERSQKRKLGDDLGLARGAVAASGKGCAQQTRTWGAPCQPVHQSLGMGPPRCSLCPWKEEGPRSPLLACLQRAACWPPTVTQVHHPSPRRPQLGDIGAE